MKTFFKDTNDTAKKNQKSVKNQISLDIFKKKYSKSRKDDKESWINHTNLLGNILQMNGSPLGYNSYFNNSHYAIKKKERATHGNAISVVGSTNINAYSKNIDNNKELSNKKFKKR